MRGGAAAGDGGSRTLLSVEEALRLVLQGIGPLPQEEVAAAVAPGRVLAADVRATRDVPPFDAAAMDGFAVRSEGAPRSVTLRVVGVVSAGRPPGARLEAGTAMRIMTGAPLPPGADAVQRFEVTQETGAGEVCLLEGPGPGENVRRAGSERRAGEVLMDPGTRLGAAQMALLASAGVDRVRVFRSPEVAVAATGDELIGEGAEPGPWQIRNSNGPLLAACAAARGARVRDLGILPDEVDTLTRAIREAVAHADMLVVSGGVSAGDFDLVTAAFTAAGLATVFHGVAVKPGKPVLHARATREGGFPVPVFGLPGNPLSALVAFLLFAAPALDRLQGRTDASPAFALARLAEDVHGDGAREQYLPARIDCPAGAVPVARVLPCRSSGDLAAAGAAAGFVRLPTGCRRLERGEVVSVLLLPDAPLRFGRGQDAAPSGA